MLEEHENVGRKEHNIQINFTNYYEKMSCEIKTNPKVPLKRLCECLLHEYYHCNSEFVELMTGFCAKIVSSLLHNR